MGITVEERHLVPQPGASYPISVQYCGSCTLPLEFCEYSVKSNDCKEWLQVNLPDVFAELHASDGVAGESGGGEATSKKSKRGGKGQSKASKGTKKVGFAGPNHIILTRAPRGKKSVTVIQGLGGYGVDLKAASKKFAQKFACGASVTGDDEIVVQGDVKEDLLDYIPEMFKEVTEDDIEDAGDQKRS